MFPLSALLAHAELKTKATRPSAEADESYDNRRAPRITRYGNLTLYPQVEHGELVQPADAFHAGESMPSDVIDATWEEPKVIASISNVSRTGVGLILNDELPRGLQFEANWDVGENPGPYRFEVVHTQPMSAGLYRTGARLLEGELPAEPVPTPFVRKYELATEVEERRLAEQLQRLASPPPAMLPAAAAAAPAPTSIPAPTGPRLVDNGPDEEPAQPRLSLVRDGVMALSRVPVSMPEPDSRAMPPGTFQMDRAAGFEKTERLDGVTVCGWERRIEMRRDGERMWVYVHSPGKKNGWGLFVDANQFEAAVNRIQLNAGSPFVATTLAA